MGASSRLVAVDDRLRALRQDEQARLRAARRARRVLAPPRRGTASAARGAPPRPAATNRDRHWRRGAGCPPGSAPASRRRSASEPPRRAPAPRPGSPPRPAPRRRRRARAGLGALGREHDVAAVAQRPRRRGHAMGQRAWSSGSAWSLDGAADVWPRAVRRGLAGATAPGIRAPECRPRLGLAHSLPPTDRIRTARP